VTPSHNHSFRIQLISINITLSSRAIRQTGRRMQMSQIMAVRTLRTKRLLVALNKAKTESHSTSNMYNSSYSLFYIRCSVASRYLPMIDRSLLMSSMELIPAIFTNQVLLPHSITKRISQANIGITVSTTTGSRLHY
jgi:hypothetical protein